MLEQITQNLNKTSPYKLIFLYFYASEVLVLLTVLKPFFFNSDETEYFTGILTRWLNQDKDFYDLQYQSTRVSLAYFQTLSQHLLKEWRKIMRTSWPNKIQTGHLSTNHIFYHYGKPIRKRSLKLASETEKVNGTTIKAKTLQNILAKQVL